MIRRDYNKIRRDYREKRDYLSPLPVLLDVTSIF